MRYVARETTWFAWASVLLEVGCLLWPLFSSHPIPLSLLDRFRVLPYAPALLAVSLLAALWLSVPRFHTRERMVRFAWMVGPIGFVGAIVIGGFFGFPLAWAGVETWRAVRQPRPNSLDVAE
jgi:hypothetical protein